MKDKVLFLALCSIFVVIFNACFFLLKSDEIFTATWISYGFIHIAYVSVLLTQFFNVKHDEVSLSLSSHFISLSYFVAELVIGVVFILVNPEGYKAALLIQLLLFGAYLIVLLTNVISNNKTISSLEESRRKTM